MCIYVCIYYIYYIYVHTIELTHLQMWMNVHWIDIDVIWMQNVPTLKEVTRVVVRMDSQEMDFTASKNWPVTSYSVMLMENVLFRNSLEGLNVGAGKRYYCLFFSLSLLPSYPWSSDFVLLCYFALSEKTHFHLLSTHTKIHSQKIHSQGRIQRKWILLSNWRGGQMWHSLCNNEWNLCLGSRNQYLWMCVSSWKSWWWNYMCPCHSTVVGNGRSYQTWSVPEISRFFHISKKHLWMFEKHLKKRPILNFDTFEWFSVFPFLSLPELFFFFFRFLFLNFFLFHSSLPELFLPISPIPDLLLPEFSASWSLLTLHYSVSIERMIDAPFSDSKLSFQISVDCKVNDRLCSPDAECSFDVRQERFVCHCIPGFVGNGLSCRPLMECRLDSNCPTNSHCHFR